MSYHVIDRNSDILCIAFSPIGSFSPKLFQNQLCRMGYSAIFVQSNPLGRKDSWYMHGIRGMGFDVSVSAAKLARKIKRIKHKKVVFLGSSMGGFGAIVYSTIIKPDGVVAFSPQFCSRLRKEYIPEKSLRYASLSKLLITDNPECPIHIHACQDEQQEKNKWGDQRSIKKLQAFSNVKIHKYDCHRHNVCKALKKMDILDKVLQESINEIINGKS